MGQTEDFLLFCQGQLKGFQTYQHSRLRLSFASSAAWQEMHEDNPSGETHFFLCSVAWVSTYFAAQNKSAKYARRGSQKASLTWRNISSLSLSLLYSRNSLSSPPTQVQTLDSQYCPWKASALWNKIEELHALNLCLYKDSGKGESSDLQFSRSWQIWPLPPILWKVHSELLPWHASGALFW